MTTRGVTVHEGAHLPVTRGGGLKPGDTVAVEMEVIKTRRGLVLYPKGKIGKAGLKVNPVMLW